MRLGRCAVLALAVCLCGAATARAGLYNTAEPKEQGPGMPEPKYLDDFRLYVTNLRAIAAPAVDFDNPIRKRYVLIADLAGRIPIDRLTLEQKINLSAVLMRRGRAVEALELLRPLARTHPDNPLVQSNLSMAYYLAGELRAAYETASSMLRGAWKPTWEELDEPQRKFLQAAGWAKETYEPNREVETYYVKMLRSRLREANAARGKAVEEHLDPLFGDAKAPMHYVGVSGKYEAGAVAPAERAKLPKNAIDIVRRLLIWMPSDPRLYWQLAELYAARAADVPKKERRAYLTAAANLLGDLIDQKKFNYRGAPEVVEHDRAIRERLAELPPENPFAADGLLKDADKKPDETGFDWRTLLVGLGVGAVAGVFAAWQLREIRRRRQIRSPV